MARTKRFNVIIPFSSLEKAQEMRDILTDSGYKGITIMVVKEAKNDQVEDRKV